MPLFAVVALCLVAGAASGPGHCEDGGHRLLKMADGTYVCVTCGWVYDPAKQTTGFDNEAAGYRCPFCGSPKEKFRAWATVDNDQVVCINGKEHTHGVSGDLMLNSAMTTDPCSGCHGYPCLPSATKGGGYGGGDSHAGHDHDHSGHDHDHGTTADKDDHSGHDHESPATTDVCRAPAFACPLTPMLASIFMAVVGCV